MDLQLVIALCITAIALIVFVAFVLPQARARWSFTFRGHLIEVTNYVFRETIAVDGVVIEGTRTGGDHMTHAWHQVTLPSGSALRVWIGQEGGRTICRVDDGEQTVFRSDAPPDLVPQKVEAAPAPDPRMTAARLLLHDIAAVDAGAARTLGDALEMLLRAENAARDAASAHAALGGGGDSAADLLCSRTAAVEEVLSTLRALHVAATASGGDDLARALSSVRETAARLSASSEVETIAKRSLAAQQRSSAGRIPT